MRRALISCALLLCAAACASERANAPPPEVAAPLSEAQRELRATRALREAQRTALGGDLAAAIPLYKDALVHFEALGDPAGQAAVHNDLGLMLYEARQLPRARVALEQARDLARQSGQPQLLTEALYNLGRAYDALALPAEADAALGEALQGAQERELRALILNARGNARRRANQLAPALEDYQAAEALWGELLRPLYVGVARMNQGYCELLRGQPDAALDRFTQARDAIAQERGADRDALDLHLDELARLCAQDPARARARVLEILGR
jgi:tetratricopeptide (TPR) repeat protein